MERRHDDRPEQVNTVLARRRLGRTAAAPERPADDSRQRLTEAFAVPAERRNQVLASRWVGVMHFKLPGQGTWAMHPSNYGYIRAMLGTRCGGGAGGKDLLTVGYLADGNSQRDWLLVRQAAEHFAVQFGLGVESIEVAEIRDHEASAARRPESGWTTRPGES